MTRCGKWSIALAPHITLHNALICSIARTCRHRAICASYSSAYHIAYCIGVPFCIGMQYCADMHIATVSSPYHAKACLSVQRQLNRRPGIIEMHLLVA